MGWHPTDARVEAALDRLRTECERMSVAQLECKLWATTSPKARRVIRAEIERRKA